MLSTSLEKILYSAARTEDIPTLLECLQSSADINSRDASEYGRTPCMLAAYSAPLKTIQWLEKNGADLKMKDNNNDTALEIAVLCASNDRLEKINFLLHKGLSFQNPLFKAIALEKLVALELIIKSPANVNKTDTSLRTALHYACAGGNLKIIQLLLKHQPNLLNKRAYGGITALMYAALHGHLETVKYLVDEKNASPKKIDLEGNTALLHAASNGHLEIVEYLNSKQEKKIESPRESNNCTHTPSQQRTIEEARSQVVNYFTEEMRLRLTPAIDKAAESIVKEYLRTIKISTETEKKSLTFFNKPAGH